jgi:hypothetical protein
MPQRDDKQFVDFGRIEQACWDRLGDQPASVIERAIPLLVEARRAGRVLCYPATLKRGIRKKLWLMPETVAILNSLSDETGLPRSSLILAALDLWFEGVPVRDASAQPGRTPEE